MKEKTIVLITKIIFIAAIVGTTFVACTPLQDPGGEKDIPTPPDKPIVIEPPPDEPIEPKPHNLLWMDTGLSQENFPVWAWNHNLAEYNQLSFNDDIEEITEFLDDFTNMVTGYLTLYRNDEKRIFDARLLDGDGTWDKEDKEYELAKDLLPAAPRLLEEMMHAMSAGEFNSAIAIADQLINFFPEVEEKSNAIANSARGGKGRPLDVTTSERCVIEPNEGIRELNPWYSANATYNSNIGKNIDNAPGGILNQLVANLPALKGFLSGVVANELDTSEIQAFLNSCYAQVLGEGETSEGYKNGALKKFMTEIIVPERLERETNAQAAK